MKAFQLAEKDGVGVDKIYAAGVAPEMVEGADIPCIDTAYVYESDLMDIFSAASTSSSVAARLIGKGLKANASVR